MTEPPNTDRYEQFVALFARHERAVRGVIRSMLPTSQDADEVMQEVGLACWHKFSNFQADGSQDAFFRWACVISRFEVLKYRRKCARDRLVLSDETIHLLSADAEDRCLVAERERQLGQSARRLYSRVNKLRELMGECVQRKLAEGGN